MQIAAYENARVSKTYWEHVERMQDSSEVALVYIVVARVEQFDFKKQLEAACLSVPLPFAKKNCGKKKMKKDSSSRPSNRPAKQPTNNPQSKAMAKQIWAEPDRETWKSQNSSLAQIWKCQNRKATESKSVRIGKC